VCVRARVCACVRACVCGGVRGVSGVQRSVICIEATPEGKAQEQTETLFHGTILSYCTTPYGYIVPYLLG